MPAPAKFAKHPIHPMLVPFPIAWWVLSLVCDIISFFNHDPVWSTFARYTILAGVIGALAAALPGAIDLYGMQPTSAKKIGIWHMSINLVITALYIGNFIWRRVTAPVSIGPIMLSIVAVLLLVVSGWLGGEMVYVHGVGVNSGREEFKRGR